jgi:hypothetical protein
VLSRTVFGQEAMSDAERYNNPHLSLWRRLTDVRGIKERMPLEEECCAHCDDAPPERKWEARAMVEMTNRLYTMPPRRDSLFASPRTPNCVLATGGI